MALNSSSGEVFRVLVWIVSGGSALSAAKSASAPSYPRRAMNSRTSQRGWLYFTLRYSAVPEPGTSGTESRFSAMRLSTPFTSPAARLFPRARQRLTPSFTAALGGTRSRNSSCAAEILSISSTVASSFFTGVEHQRPIT